MKQGTKFDKEISSLVEKSIFFQTKDYVFVNKLAGLTTTPTRWGEKDARPCLGIILQEIMGKQIYPIHRLDWEVSGITMFALNANAHRQGNNWFLKRLVEKRYRAMSEFPTEQTLEIHAEFNWQDRIKRGKKRAFLAPDGEMAQTTAIYLEKNRWENNDVAHWELIPHTGRSHQLRFHMYKGHFPLLGDRLYSAQSDFRPNEIALKAISLNFKNAPDRGELPELITLPNLSWN